MFGCAILVLAPLQVAGRYFYPPELSYADLAHGSLRGIRSDAARKALTANGVLAVRGIPGFAKLRRRTLQGAHACITVAPHAQSHAFPDGTIRQTLAAESGFAMGQRAVDHGSDVEACRTWDRVSQDFRRTVGSVLDLFAKQLGDAHGTEGVADGNSGDVYGALQQMVETGERLEHFHTYHLPATSNLASGDQTLNYHVDQGLFIAFVPAMLVDDASSPADPRQPTGIFSLRSADGEELEADFQEDSLVIMAGDGIYQYLGAHGTGIPIRAPSHAFRMPRGGPGWHRVWYGMMQLPPVNARNRETGMSFGEIRRGIVTAMESDGPAEKTTLALGCSRKLQARELMSTCKANQVYCWHRCMDYTATASPTVCQQKGLGWHLNCTSQFGEIYRAKDGHGDYNLACTNSTKFVTPRPVVVQPTGTCSGWSALLADANYTHRVRLSPSTYSDTYFLWNVVGDEVQGKMIHKGLAGWLGFGFENIGGGKNGMQGAHIVMGLNDPDAGLSIDEYKIHDKMSAWRHWKTPLNPTSLKSASMTVTNCFSYMTFQTKTIHGKSFNITSGTNRMIWGLTHNAYVTQDYGGYAPYHTGTDKNTADRSQFRGKVAINLATGAAKYPTTATTSKPTNTSLVEASLGTVPRALTVLVGVVPLVLSALACV